MLSTKDMSAGGGKIKPVISVGINTIKINRLELVKLPYDSETLNVNLHVESKPMGSGFQGFLKDINDPDGPRYEGQVGRVRLTPYPFKNATLPNGTEIYRDTEILKSMIFLAETLGKREELDMIEADTIEDFVSSCNDVLSNSDFFNACVGGKEWENKDGYINHDLFLPKRSRDGVPMEKADIENSQLLTYNEADHIVKMKKTSAPTETAKFEPSPSDVGDDFDL